MDPDYKLFLKSGGTSEESYELIEPTEKAKLFLAFNESKRRAPAAGNVIQLR